MTEDRGTETEPGRERSARESFGEGVRAGIGILAGFKEAIEETIAEARERGDLSPERAKEIVKSAMARAQVAAEEARDRLDFATRSELESLEARLRELSERVRALEEASAAPGGSGPVGRDDPGAAGAEEPPGG